MSVEITASSPIRTPAEPRTGLCDGAKGDARATGCRWRRWNSFGKTHIWRNESYSRSVKDPGPRCSPFILGSAMQSL